MTLTPEKLDEIERLAELATPGARTWSEASEGSSLVGGLWADGAPIIRAEPCADAWIDGKEEDLQFLAALDPATARELVRAAKERDHQAARIAALEQRLGKLASARDEAIQRLTAIKSDDLETEDAAYQASHALMSLMLVGEGSPILEGDEVGVQS